MSEHDPLENGENDAISDDSDAEQELYETVGPNSGISRRDFLRGSAAVAGAAATGAGAQQLGYGPVQEAEAIAPAVGIAGYAAAGAIMGAAADYGGFDLTFWTDDVADAESQTADIVHSNTYTNVVNSVDMQSAFLDDLRDETGVSADRPAAGGLGAIAWSEIRAAVHNALKNGDTQEQATADAQAALDDYISQVLKDFYSRWNEVAKQIRQNRYTVWRAAASNSSLSESDVFAKANNSVTEKFTPAWGNGNTNSDSFGAPGDNPPSFSETESLYEASLPNGDTIDVQVAIPLFGASGASAASPYVFWPGAYPGDGDVASTISRSQIKRFGPEEVNSNYSTVGGDLGVDDPSNYEHSVLAVNPDSGSNLEIYSYAKWQNVYTSIMDFYNNVSGEISNYVSTVYSNYTAEDVGEILTALDIRREFSDDEMGAAVAEYIAMGYAADDVDMGTTVRVSADTSNTEDGVTEEVEGVLLADIPEDTLASWEFSINSSTLTINDASLRSEYRSEGDDRTYTVVYDDGSGNEVTEQVTAGSDFAEGDTVELSNATQSTLIRVERDTSNWDGDIATAIPSGTTISASDYRNARMVYKTGGDTSDTSTDSTNTTETDTTTTTTIERIELGGDIELLEVVEENRSEVVFTSWVNVTSDPAVSKEEMDELLDAQQETIEELSTLNQKGIVGMLFGSSGVPSWVPLAGAATIIAWFALDDN